MRLNELDLTTLMEDLPFLGVPQRVSIVLVSWVLLAIASYAVFWMGSMDENKRLDGEIRSALTRLESQSMLLLEAPVIEGKLAQLEQQLPQLTLALPTERELASLLGRINEMILGQSLSLSEFTPQAPVNKEVMRAVPVKVRVRGPGAAIAKLPNEIASLSRQVSLKEFEMSVIAESGAWQMNGELTAFAQLPTDASSPPADESGKEKSR